MPNDGDGDSVLDELREQLRAKDRELEQMRVELQEARTTGIAVGVLLARTPGWTEQDAWAAWERACARLTRGGNTKALASYIVQTGQLPGEGVSARV